MKKKKKIWKTVAIIIVVVIILAVVLGRKNSANSMYEEETAQIRDIITYNKFSGNVAANENKNIVSDASAKVLSVLVDEGDEVKEGDVIAVLDSSTLEYTISLKEAALDITDLNNLYNRRDAQKAYDDYKAGIENGENSQLLSAKSALTNAQINLENAQKNYRDALEGQEDGSTLAAAHAAALSASDAVSQAQVAYDENENQIAKLQALSITATSGDASLVSSQLEVLLTKRASLQSALSSARTAYSSAYNAYTSSSDSLDDAIEKYEIAVENAQTAYDMARDTYDATVTAVDQALKSYENALEKTNALSSNTTSVLELENLYDQLEDYTITAPMDGVITSLTAKEGSMVSTGMTVAVVTDFDIMEIEIKIDEYDILGIEVGTEVEVNVDALESTFAGTISEISRFATVAGGVSYFTAKVEFSAEENVRSGMSVEVKTVSRSAPQSVSVSVDAIRTNKDNTTYVMMRDEKGKEYEQPVTVGVSDGLYVQVTEGLSEGDVVLITPTNSMYEMMRQMQ
jgi:RND family efflux transporter MFP subunit